MSQDKWIEVINGFCKSNYPDLKCHVIDDGEVIYALLTDSGHPVRSKMVYWNCWYGNYEVFEMSYERRECG